MVLNLILVQSQILTRKVDRSRNQLNESFQLVLWLQEVFIFEVIETFHQPIVASFITALC